MPEPFSILPLTPEGRGGIGSLLISGPGAEKAFRALFTFQSGRAPSPADLESRRNRPIFGHFSLGKDLHEEVLVRAISPTELEIHSHGGGAIRSAIIRRLTEAGGTLRRDDPPTWDGPTAGTPDFRAEAMNLLPHARTERTARLLLDQANGAGKRFFEKAAGLTSRARRAALARIELLARVGRALYQAPRVLLIGPVNAGKSSLLNAILGFDRALVDPMAGTTRDVVSAETILGGLPFRLSDTAGVREAPGTLEKEGMIRIVPLLKKADILLTVFDVTAPGDDPIAEFTRAFRAMGGNLDTGAPPDILVLNKCDLPSASRNRFWKTAPYGQHGLVETSVFRPETIAALQQKLIDVLFPALPEPDEFVPINARQLEYARARCR